mmetsp:Transcript_1825/g.4567  ORF Transcript_1825/g.4567 Transcript_1825/m.4567 type:complete len:204 (-) Transcript_1825:131-742(-)
MMRLMALEDVSVQLGTSKGSSIERKESSSLKTSLPSNPSQTPSALVRSLFQILVPALEEYEVRLAELEGATVESSLASIVFVRWNNLKLAPFLLKVACPPCPPLLAPLATSRDPEEFSLSRRWRALYTSDRFISGKEVVTSSCSPPQEEESVCPPGAPPSGERTCGSGGASSHSDMLKRRLIFRPNTMFNNIFVLFSSQGFLV